jgi:hypothetical protein
MPEEIKEEKKEPEEPKGEKVKAIIKTILKVILGIVLIALGLWLLFGRLWWWAHCWTVIRGCLGPFLILCGIITLAIAKE